MNKERIKEIIDEQWGDQALHLAIGGAITYTLCALTGSAFAVVLPALGWIAWEHSQRPHHNSKGYDDQSIDRFFQEAGLMLGLWFWW